MLKTDVVVIPLERYTELVDKETRIKVVEERVNHDEYFSTEDIMWILGAARAARDIRDKARARRENWDKKHSLIEVIDECEKMD